MSGFQVVVTVSADHKHAEIEIDPGGEEGSLRYVVSQSLAGVEVETISGPTQGAPFTTLDDLARAAVKTGASLLERARV